MAKNANNRLNNASPVGDSWEGLVVGMTCVAHQSKALVMPD